MIPIPSCWLRTGGPETGSVITIVGGPTGRLVRVEPVNTRTIRVTVTEMSPHPAAPVWQDVSYLVDSYDLVLVDGWTAVRFAGDGDRRAALVEGALLYRQPDVFRAPPGRGHVMSFGWDLPPGVTGREYEIAGLDSERDDIRAVSCRDPECGFVGDVDGLLSIYRHEAWFDWTCPMCGRESQEEIWGDE